MREKIKKREIEQALAATREDLGLPGNSSLPASNLSVLLAHLTLSRLSRLPALHHTARSLTVHRLAKLKRHKRESLLHQAHLLLKTLTPVPEAIAAALAPGIELKEILSLPSYRERLLKMIEECLLLQEGVSPLRISPRPLTSPGAAEILPGKMNLAVVFTAESVSFQETLLALSVDALLIPRRDRIHPTRAATTNIIAARPEWLDPTGTHARRLITLDKENNPLETELENPLPIQAGMILHLAHQGEIASHRSLSCQWKEAGIPQVNPYEPASERADRKAEAHRIWESDPELLTPQWTLVPRGASLEYVRDQLNKFARKLTTGTRPCLTPDPDALCSSQNYDRPAHLPVRAGGKQVAVFAQPNQGTEGDLVERFILDAEMKEIVKYLEERILPTDDALVREEKGNVFFQEENADKDGPLLRITFRLHVAWDGEGFVAESGYAQLAPEERNPVASRGRGGRIISLAEAFSSLTYREQQPSPAECKYAATVPGGEDISNMKKCASRALALLNDGLEENDYLRFAGVDLLWETRKTDRGKITLAPVILEINPRPAGLSLSTSIPPRPGAASRPFITRALFASLSEKMEE